MQQKIQIKKTKKIMKEKKNQKIGRPSLRDDQQQFKLKFLKNQKRFEIEAQLLVNIYEIFRKEEIEIKNTENRVPQDILCTVFQQFHMSWLYAALYKNNHEYYQDRKHIQYNDSLNYTSIIDVLYMFRLINNLKKTQGISKPALKVKEIFGIILFYLDNQKLVNDSFLNYYIHNLVNHQFQKIMFNGPNPFSPLANITTLLVMLALQLLQKQEILVEQPNIEILKSFSILQEDMRKNLDDDFFKNICAQTDNQKQTSNNESSEIDVTAQKSNQKRDNVQQGQKCLDEKQK